MPTPVTLIAQWASVAASIATVLALGGLWVQIRSASRVQEQAAARQLYAEFLEFAATHAEVLRDRKPEPGSQYDWAMYLWLTALESGWRAFDKSEEWTRLIACCARQNPTYFNSAYWLGAGRFQETGVSQDFDAAFAKEMKRLVKVEEARAA